MLGLGCLKLDEKGKIFMVSDVRKMHLTSDTSVFLKKKCICDQKSENFQISVALIDLDGVF